MRKMVLLIVVLLTFSSHSVLAVTPPKPGLSCSKQGIKETHKGKQYRCVKKGKKLIWNQGARVEKNNSISTLSPKQPPMATPMATPISCVRRTSLPAPVIKSIDLNFQTKRYSATILIPAIDQACGDQFKVYFDFSGVFQTNCSNPRVEIMKTPLEIICKDLPQQSSWRMYLTTFSQHLETYVLSDEVFLRTPPITIPPVVPEPRPTDLSKLPYVKQGEFCDEPYAGKWARNSLNELLVCNTAPQLGMFYFQWRKP
jgi:hypothetical protein